MNHDRQDLLEPLVERLMREAIEAGEFDGLPGYGKPIPGAGRRDDDLWWVRSWMRRNDLDPGSIVARAESGPG